jgi:hypothetical protein
MLYGVPKDAAFTVVDAPLLCRQLAQGEHSLRRNMRFAPDG